MTTAKATDDDGDDSDDSVGGGGSSNDGDRRRRNDGDDGDDNDDSDDGDIVEDERGDDVRGPPARRQLAQGRGRILGGAPLPRCWGSGTPLARQLAAHRPALAVGFGTAAGRWARTTTVTAVARGVMPDEVLADSVGSPTAPQALPMPSVE